MQADSWTPVALSSKILPNIDIFSQLALPDAESH